MLLLVPITDENVIAFGGTGSAGGAREAKNGFAPINARFDWVFICVKLRKSADHSFVLKF
jgi:hypothetical protein